VIKFNRENRSLKDQLMSKKDNEIDTLFPFINDSLQFNPKRILFTLNPLPKIISVDGAEVMSTISIIINFLILSILIYSILTLLLIAIIRFIIRKKIWNS